MFSRFFTDRPIFASVLSIVIVLAGGIAVGALPIAQYPDITPPTVGIQAHSAPLGLAFYSGQQFPADYANDIFVVQHGSWNRQPPAEPKLLRIHFDAGRRRL